MLWCIFALLCGGIIKGALGVGTPLLTVPMLALVLPPQAAVALMAMPVVVANLWQAAQAPRGHRVIQRQWTTAVAIIAGGYVGTLILANIDERPLLLIVGTLVLSFTFLQSSPFSFEIAAHRERLAGCLFGFMAGLIGGLSSMFGPMMVIYLMSLKDLDKEQFVGLISFLYLAAVIPWAIQLQLRGLLDFPIWLYSLAGVIPVTVGMAIGQQLREKVTEQGFRRLLQLILVTSAATLIWRALR